MKHSTQLLSFACIAVIAACNRPPSASASSNAIPHKVGSAQSPSLEFAPGTGTTPLQYAVLDMDSKSLQQKVQERKTGDTSESKRNADASPPGKDLNFLQRIGNDAQSEEQAALYVASKTTNSDVRDYAAQVGRDHGKASQELRKLAAKRGMEIPSDPVGQLRQKLDRLRQLSGAQMDKAYLQDFAVQAHMESIALFESQEAQGQDKELKSFAAKQLPRLRKYYERGKALEANYKPTSSRIDI